MVDLGESSAALAFRLLVDYATALPAERPLPETLTLRGDLGLDSMALVSLLVRLGDELDLEVADLDVELATVKTVGDLIGCIAALRAPSGL